MTATSSDTHIESDLLDQELINDLGTGQPENLSGTIQDVTLTDIHQSMILCNQLLGLIIALLILSYAMALLEFFIKLVTKNITNHM